MLLLNTQGMCGWDSANSSEFDASTEYPIIDIMPDQKDIENMGGQCDLENMLAS